MRFIDWLRRVALAASFVFALPVSAQEALCNDANIFGSRLITDVCWSCMLPITLLGVGGGPDDPPDRNREPVCLCYDGLGVPSFGITFGGWLPYRLFETVRVPWCVPSLGGIYLNTDRHQVGGPHTDAEDHHASKNYWHTHVYSFPLATMMELLTNKECNAGNFNDFDVIMMSEFDPLAADDELSLFIYFETAMFANPLAVASCAIECGTLSAGVAPSSGQLWWCAGCWGPLYPLSNNTNRDPSRHQTGSLASARQLAIKHRRGLGHITYGTENMCGGKVYPFLPKEQYKWSQLFSRPEAEGRCAHWTGESEYKTGGSSRSIPFSGEDQVFMLWRYTDCCLH